MHHQLALCVWDAYCAHLILTKSSANKHTQCTVEAFTILTVSLTYPRVQHNLLSKYISCAHFLLARLSIYAQEMRDSARHQERGKQNSMYLKHSKLGMSSVYTLKDIDTCLYYIKDLRAYKRQLSCCTLTWEGPISHQNSTKPKQRFTKGVMSRK